MEHGTPITFPEDESFDIGSDTRTGIAMLKYRYEVPFKFTGKIDKLTFKLTPMPEATLASKAEHGPITAPEPDPIDTSKRKPPRAIVNLIGVRTNRKQTR